MTKIELLHPITVVSDETGSHEIDIQHEVYQKLAKPDKNGKATIKPKNYEDISLFLTDGGTIGTKKFKVTEITKLPVPGYPGVTINNLEYLSQFPNIELLEPDNKPFSIINVDINMLTTNARYIWSHFCSLFGQPPLHDVGQFFYDKASYEYNFCTVARLVKMYDSETKTNVLRVMIANKYFIPVEYTRNDDGDGVYKINNGKNSIELKIINAYNDQTGENDKPYPEIQVRDKKNKFLDYVISMSIDKNTILSMEEFVEYWNDGDIDSLPITPPLIPSLSYAKILKFPAANGFMENGIYLLLYSPKLITNGIMTGCSNWSVEVPSKFKELSISTDGNTFTPDEVLGNVESLMFSKNCPVSTMLKGLNNPNHKVVVIIRKFDSTQKASPGMQVLLSASKLGIPAQYRNDSEFMDYVTMNLPSSIFAEKPLDVTPALKNYDDDPF